MRNLQIRKTDKYQAETAFMQDSAGDFPKDSPGDKAAKRLAEAVSQIETLGGVQSSQTARQSTGVKDDALNRLIKLLQKMNRAANSLAEDVDGIEDLFRMPRRRSEAIWLSTARAFHTDSAPFEAEFEDFDLTKTFRADLLALIAEVEQAKKSGDVAEEQKGGAGGGIEAAITEAGKLSRRLNNIVLNKYADDAQKLAAWAIASHLEAAPKRAPKPVV